jgi:hypothetical protein
MRGGRRQARRKLTLWSNRGFAELDGRLVEAREERRIIRELTEHVGRPSVPQAILIRRAARLLIMLTQLERRIIEGNDLGDLTGRQCCALHNALRLSLSALGLERAEAQVPSVADFLAAQRGRDAA